MKIVLKKSLKMLMGTVSEVHFRTTSEIRELNVLSVVPDVLYWVTQFGSIRSNSKSYW